MSGKKVDWLVIEQHWRAGIRTKKEIAEEFGISRAAMDKHFAKLGIERDLLPKIQAKAQEKVLRAVAQEVAQEVTHERLRVTEPGIVEVNAQVQASTVMRHRRGIERAWGVVDMLFAELEHQTENAALYAELGELMASPDDKGVDKLGEIYRKAMSLPSRSSTVKTLLEALKTAIGLEREALGITDRTLGSDDDPLTSLLRRVQGSALKPVTTFDGEFEREAD